MKVDVFTLDGTQDRLVGSLALRNQRLELSDPQDAILRAIAENVILGPGRRLYSRSRPAQFLRQLHKTYRNAYLRVSPVRRSEA